MSRLQAHELHGREPAGKPLHIAIIRSHHVVYHAQCGHQLGAGALRKDLVGEREDDYQEGMVTHPAELAGVFGAKHVEVAGHYGDGRPEFERGGEGQDFASCVHNWSATAAT